MCGIAGFWGAEGIDTNTSIHLKNMIQRLHHRGPDGYGHHFDPDKGLALGHARLSIIDLETGEQPLYSYDKNNVLTVNGEFYDYKRLRTNLVLDGFKFRTKSDSEIALYLYEKYGLDFVQHLRGEFAFVLYDGKNDRMIVVRDRFGIRPMFYHHSENTFYYASEVKALFANPNIPRKFSSKAVLHQLMHTMSPGTSSFEDVHALKPGHMLIIQRKNGSFDITEKCYWDMDFPRKDERDHSKSEGYYIEQTKDKLAEAVRFRLEADVPVGCYLSGGIDSCSMLGLASSMQQSPVKAYTISFDHKDYDESDIATEMAQRVQADQEILNLNAAGLYGDNYIKTLWHAERTFYNTLGVAKMAMSKRVWDSGFRVVVTGEGADELFGGYPAFKRDMLKYGADEHSTPDEVASYKALMEKTNKLFKGAILSEEQVSHPAFDDVCGFTPSWIQPWMQTLEIARPLLHDDVLHEIGGYDPIENIAHSFNRDQLDGRHYLDKAQYTWIKTMLECQILNWGGDRVDMANSMESRPAFLDHHVAEMARDIPPHYRIKGNIEKWVLREAMKNVLPNVLYEREKFAFMAPPGHTEKNKVKALDALLDNYMSEGHIKKVGLFDVKRLRKFVDDYKADKDPVSLVRKDALLNHLLSLHIMHDHFIDQSSGYAK